MPSILFAHSNFPAQFGAFGQWLVHQGWKVAYTTSRGGVQDPLITVVSQKPHREATKGIHPYAVSFEQSVLQGQALTRGGLLLAEKGFRPDVIVAHSGWGAGFGLPDVFPDAVFVPFLEWWYNTPAVDAVFLSPIFGPVKQDVESRLVQSSRNAPMAYDIARADALWSPTQFQAAQFPVGVRSRMTVAHDGIDTDIHAPAVGVYDRSLGGLIPEDASLITYATRGQEPHRGFVEAMGSIAYALNRLPTAHAVVVGENRVAYGGSVASKVDWRARALETFSVDRSRLHFLDFLPRSEYLRVLQRSQAHVYLTAPFVLSWSMLESMAVGVPLVASATAPVEEYAVDGETALLRPFYDIDALGEAIVETVGDKEGASRRGAAARAHIVASLSKDVLWPQRLAWLNGLIKEKRG